METQQHCRLKQPNSGALFKIVGEGGQQKRFRILEDPGTCTPACPAVTI